MIKYFLMALFLASATLSYAQSSPMRMPAKQVDVRTNTITTLGQTYNATYAPSNSLQAILEWLDDQWSGAQFSTNNSYYYTNGTTQNMWRLTVRDYLTVNGSATVATNLYVGDSLVVSNDASILDDLLVGDDATVGGDLVVSNSATVNGALTAGSLSTTGALNAASISMTGTFLNSSNDMALSFMGYPKVTLTTNMVTTSATAGTALTISQFADVFDASLATRATASTAAGFHVYRIDLGSEYQGWLIFSFGSTNNPNSSQNTSTHLNVSKYPMSSNGKVVLSGTDGAYANGMFVNAGTAEGGTTNATYNAFQGRYIYISVGGDSSTPDYFFSDLSVYGQIATNAFRNMGGSQ